METGATSDRRFQKALIGSVQSQPALTATLAEGWTAELAPPRSQEAAAPARTTLALLHRPRHTSSLIYNTVSTLGTYSTERVGARSLLHNSSAGSARRSRRKRRECILDAQRGPRWISLPLSFSPRPHLNKTE